MAERYQPASYFLRAVRDNDAPLSGSQFGEENLRRLISFTHDMELSNREWATFLLAWTDINTPEVRDALLAAVKDDDEWVRAEAIFGLARRDRDMALPLIRKALGQQSVPEPIFEAAAIVAQVSLVEALRPHLGPSDDEYLDGVIEEAFVACKSKTPGSWACLSLTSAE